jgi:hypothetical protein
LQERIARREGFRVLDHKLELYGYCRSCSGGRKTPFSFPRRRAGDHE